MSESSSLPTKFVGPKAATSTVTAAKPRPFPSHRFTWNDLVHIIQVEQDLAKLRRSQQDQEYYNNYMDRIRAEYKTVMDFILASKMDIPTQIDPVSGKKIAPLDGNATTTTMIRDTCQKRLVRNDFPYYFELDVEHWILWKLGGDGVISATELEEAKQQLRQDLGNVVDDLHWVNPPELKSIPEIDHVHILVRRRCEMGKPTT
eukprot:scaffold2026_cov176-Amphora_coffeaeformis.AAC.4